MSIRRDIAVITGGAQVIGICLFNKQSDLIPANRMVDELRNVKEYAVHPRLIWC